MDSRTERILRALGNREAFAIVLGLLAKEMTTSTLAKETQFSPATVVATLETLSQATLVDRQRVRKVRGVSPIGKRHTSCSVRPRPAARRSHRRHGRSSR